MGLRSRSGDKGTEEGGGFTESEVDSHVVVWDGSGWKGDSGLSGEEEWKRQVKSVSDTGIKSVKEDWGLTIRGHGFNSGSDHLIVSRSLGGIDSEGGPEIKID